MNAGNSVLFVGVRSNTEGSGNTRSLPYVPSDLWLTVLFIDTLITVNALDCRGVHSSCYGKIVYFFFFFPSRFPPLTCRVVKEKLC